MAKDDEVTLDTLAEDYRTATGCTPEEAADVLAQVCAWHEIKPAVLPKFIAIHAQTPLLPIHVLICLYVLARLMRTANGNEFLFYLGMLAAKRCGIAPDLIEKLREFVPKKPADEVRH